jgi:hypothetical protein
VRVVEQKEQGERYRCAHPLVQRVAKRTTDGIRKEPPARLLIFRFDRVPPSSLLPRSSPLLFFLHPSRFHSAFFSSSLSSLPISRLALRFRLNLPSLCFSVLISPCSTSSSPPYLSSLCFSVLISPRSASPSLSPLALLLRLRPYLPLLYFSVPALSLLVLLLRPYLPSLYFSVPVLISPRSTSPSPSLSLLALLLRPYLPSLYFSVPVLISPRSTSPSLSLLALLLRPYLPSLYFSVPVFISRRPASPSLWAHLPSVLTHCRARGVRRAGRALVGKAQRVASVLTHACDSASCDR